MRVLIVGINYRPEPTGIGPYTAGLAEHLAARPERWAARLARAGLHVSCSAATRPDPSGARDGRRQLVSSRRTNPARRSEKPRLAAAQVVLGCRGLKRWILDKRVSLMRATGSSVRSSGSRG